MPLPDIDDLASVGGAKQNLHPVADPVTDEDAAHRNIVFSNDTASTWTIIRAWVRFTTVNGAAPTLTAHWALWGNSVSVAPTLARTGEGVWTVTWPASVTDQLGNSHALNLRDAMPKCSGTTARFVNATITSPNAATIYTFLATGTADDIPGEVIGVFVV